MYILLWNSLQIVFYGRILGRYREVIDITKCKVVKF